MKIWLALISMLATVPYAEGVGIFEGITQGCALSDGKVFCWGHQLITTTTDGSTTPVQVSGITTATSIAQGNSHACTLLTSGEIKCWGLNDQGQLGNGTSTDGNTPVDVSGIMTATSITFGPAAIRHSCAVLSNGKVMCWGNNFYGQLGDGTETSSYIPVEVSGISTATSVALGMQHSCALLAVGSVKCWGSNRNGNLGNGTSTSSNTPVDVSGITTATGISVGKYTSCALLANGKVLCWSSNKYGQLGVGTWGDNSRFTPVEVSGIETATSIAVGYYHVCAVLSNGKVMCWGYNWDGQLGDSTNNNYRTAPVEVSGITTATSIACSGSHSCALLTDGSNNVLGQKLIRPAW